MPAANRWLARLLLGQLGRTPAHELALVVMGAGGLPVLDLARSDRRLRHVAAVRREMALRTIGAVEAIRVARGVSA